MPVLLSYARIYNVHKFNIINTIQFYIKYHNLCIYIFYLYIIYVIIYLVARYLLIHISISTIILFYYIHNAYFINCIIF